MYTFLYASIPLILVLVCCANGTFSWKSFIPPVVFGFLVAFVFAFCKKFVIFNEYVWTDNSVAAMLHLWMFNVILPLVICMSVFCIFDRSGMSYKSASMSPMMLTFYSIMVPFVVMNGDDHLSMFMVYGKPLLYAGMVIFMGVFATMAVDSWTKKLYPLAIVFALVALAVTFVASIVEARWYYSGNSVYVLISVALCGAAVLVHIFQNVVKGIINKPKEA